MFLAQPNYLVVLPPHQGQTVSGRDLTWLLAKKKHPKKLTAPAKNRFDYVCMLFKTVQNGFFLLNVGSKPGKTIQNTFVVRSVIQSVWFYMKFKCLWQEARVSRAVELMVAHVENLRRRHDRNAAELEEAKRVIQQQNSCRSTIDTRASPGLWCCLSCCFVLVCSHVQIFDWPPHRFL